MNLKQLAADLGLSPTTVSRALNGYPEVSESTRRRVTDAARRYGYRPNARARGLALGRTMAIGHVIPISTRHEIVNPVFADFIAGAGEVYTRKGYDLLLSVVPDDVEAQAYRDLGRTGSVDGVIVHGPHQGDPRIGLLQSVGLPFVVHGRATGDERGYSWVDVDNHAAFERATRHLLDLGHRRIAVLNGIATMDFARRREAGAAAALAEYGLRLDPRLVRHGEMTEEYGYRGARELLATADAPTAFITSSLISALGVRRAVGDLGLTLGRAVSLVTFDDDHGYLRNGGPRPMFSAVRSSVRDAGHRAAEMLLDLVRAPETGPLTHLFAPEWIDGASTGPAPVGAVTC